jgi:transposase
VSIAARGDDQARSCRSGDQPRDPEERGAWAPGASRPRGRRSEAPAEPATALEAENAALRKKVREVEEEREIQPKAAKYFAGETRW